MSPIGPVLKLIGKVVQRYLPFLTEKIPVRYLDPVVPEDLTVLDRKGGIGHPLCHQRKGVALHGIATPENLW